jgi:hypothetical protein
MLIPRRRKMGMEMNPKLKLKKNEMAMKSNELEQKTKRAIGVGRVLTQKIVRKEKIQKLSEHKSMEQVFRCRKEAKFRTSH